MTSGCHWLLLCGVTVTRLCLQVQQFSNKSVDMSLRVASLDYLGIVAARLRKDAVSSRLNEEVIHEIIDQVRHIHTLVCI